MDSLDAPLGDFFLVLSDPRQHVRRSMGLRSPRLGWLLGLGSGRERRLYAMAGDDRDARVQRTSYLPIEAIAQSRRVRIVPFARSRVPVQQPDAGGDRVCGFLGHDLSGAVRGGARREDYRRTSVLQSRERTA